MNDTNSAPAPVPAASVPAAMGAAATCPAVTVFGAYGHTGRFVMAELLARGLAPILSGRDPDTLRALGRNYPEPDIRPASVDDPAGLDRALDGAAAVINCAGPFALTSAPLIEAALRARIPYLDVTAEIEVVADTLSRYTDRAHEAGILVVPAMAFYGGLGDLLATAAADDWSDVDAVSIAYGLSGWIPTQGTRRTSDVSRQRRSGRRVFFTDHRMGFRAGDAPVTEWAFPAPLGTRPVVGEFTMADSATIPSHLKVREIRSYMSMAAVTDLSAAGTPELVAVDERGRSAQTFLVDVVVDAHGSRRRAVASGRDIYAISAPLVVEATRRVLAMAGGRTGVATAGALFDARDFLRALAPDLAFDTPAANS